MVTRNARTTPPTEERESLGGTLAFAIFASALAMRLFVLGQLERVPLFRTPQLDSLPLIEWARAVAHGDFAFTGLAVHSPGYPYFLGALLRLSGGSLPFVRIVQAVLGSLLCVVLAETASKIQGRVAGICTGILAACYAVTIWTELSILSEGILLLLLGLYLASFTLARRGSSWALVSGGLLGLAVLVRPTALLFGVLLLPAIGGRTWRDAVRATLIVVAVVVLPIAFESRAAGGFVPLQGNGGLNFAIGNSPFGTGRSTARPGAGWDRLSAQASRLGHFEPAERDRYFYSRTLAEIRRNPLREIRLFGSKILWTVQAEEVRDTDSFYYFSSLSPGLRWLPGFGLLLPLAAVGLLVPGARSWPRFFPAFLAVAAVTCVFLVVGLRYRLPLVEGLLIAAGRGCVATVEAIRGRRRAVAGLAMLVATGISRAAHDPENFNFSEEWALSSMALAQEGDLASARRDAERSIHVDPRSALAWQALGSVALDNDQLDDARAAYSRAAELEPGVEAPHFKLGTIEERLRSPDRAAEEYLQALTLSPRDLEALLGLGRCRLAQARVAEAKEIFRRASALMPGLAQPHSALAVVAEMELNPTAAYREARRATELAPGNGEAWFLFASAAAGIGDVRTARDALERASSLGFSPEGVERLRQYLVRTPL